MLLGLGNPSARLRFVIENPPPMSQYQHLSTVLPLSTQQRAAIEQACGNHWKKIFACLAKISQPIFGEINETWQDYRQERLLRSRGNEALLFHHNELSLSDLLPESNRVTLVMGKRLSQLLAIEGNLCEKGDFFEVADTSVVITPYPDYRQLSNAKIDRLITLIKPRLTSKN
ncbi:DUF6942 family protein [Pleionea litopenaei]|uniref:Uncharacterized protein n=1 Tax=Pleionea litopenaei TaxID=3070815 RepID=A0AA51RW16_9GAMM|nr:hypothetical protein [Pleionea sp. HL-JVS1]WMS88499.1 hypothetical protein Q9312_06175 [Pleionea sp. HL-JVS1]